MFSIQTTLPLTILSFITYKVTTNPLQILGITSRDVNRPHPFTRLFICSHDYEHVDLFCVSRAARRWYNETGRRTVFVVAPRAHNRAFCSLVHQGKCIRVMGGTTRRVIDALGRGYNVCMFVYRDAGGTGAYHMCRHESRFELISVTSRHVERMTLESGKTVCDAVVGTMGREFSLTYRAIGAPAPTERPEDFVRRLKAALYQKSASVAKA